MVSGYHLLVLYWVSNDYHFQCTAPVAMRRDDTPATEAAIKYFVLGAGRLRFFTLMDVVYSLYGLSGSLQTNTLRISPN